ncbi:porin [Aliidiomarina sedimenti]|uniref:Porin n=1 Tax=Aliidiomarina sedimenti TaxID=1933879 RepID=A0ABY0BVN2_9GAMM|nr:porin [Aliidiomarina sedimenti]RUO28108.1 porin [Aliidiomarina sedimenti]
MSKLLTSIVVILLAALSTERAHAQTSEDVDIEIYGRAHLSLDQLGDGESSGLNVSSNLSHLGFRGDYDINQDYEVFFQIEQLIRYGQRGSELASRDSFAGIRSDMGSVRIGYFEPPGTTLRSRVDMFNSRIGDARNIASGNNMAFDVRFRNGIHYTSPTLQGFTFDLQYTPHDDTGPTVSNDQEGLSARVTYTTDALYLGLAYQEYEEFALTPQAWRLGMEYSFSSSWIMTGYYQRAEQLEGGPRDVYGVGLAYRFGDYALRSQWYTSSANNDPNTGASMWVVGLDKRFTRRFSGYLVYGLTDNEPAADFSVSAGGRDTGLTPLLGETATALSLGMIFNF